MLEIILKKSVMYNPILMIVICMGMITPSISSTIRSINSSLSSSATFDGNLYSSSPYFVRPYGSQSTNYYYQMIKLIVDTTGQYTLTSSSSSFNIYGCLYDTFFKSSDPYNTLLAYSETTGSQQFQINHYLERGSAYILVVTSSLGYTTGSYQISVSGIGTISMTTYTTTTTSRYGYLSSSNPTFSRPNGYSSHYYYDTIDVTIYTSGTYTFKSGNSFSTSIYGCLYRGSFYPNSPSLNQIECDQYSGGSSQFLLRENLYSSIKYILVVTTTMSYTTGSYSITVEGPSSVSMSITTPNHGGIIIEPVVAGIIAGCSFLVLALIIFLIVYFRRRRQAAFRQTPCVAQYNPSASNVSYPNVYQTSYGDSPPSYNTFMTSNK